MPEPCLVLGIGNPARGDDAAGRIVARRLRSFLAAGIEVAEEDGEATALLAHLEGRTRVFLVDACVSGAPPGSVRRCDVRAGAPLPPGRSGVSTHGLGAAQALALAAALGRLPPCCVLYLIEGASFEIGAALSSAVARAVDEVASRLRSEILRLPPDPGAR